MVQLAAIFTGIVELIGLGYKVAALFKEAKEKGWIKDGRSLYQAIGEAKDETERADLARVLFERKFKL